MITNDDEDNDEDIELKDDRMEKYGSLFVFISKSHCRATLKNLLADGRGG